MPMHGYRMMHLEPIVKFYHLCFHLEELRKTKDICYELADDLGHESMKSSFSKYILSGPQKQVDPCNF